MCEVIFPGLDLRLEAGLVLLGLTGALDLLGVARARMNSELPLPLSSEECDDSEV